MTTPWKKRGPFPLPGSDVLRYTLSLGPGWNLGNTFDACGRGDRGLAWETAWCGVPTTRALMERVREAGFRTVRIPVSWHNHVSGEDHRIDGAWLARVRQVTDWCLDCGLHVVLNIQHDNSGDWIYPDEAHMPQSLRYIRSIWAQLCDCFADCDEQRLIFNSMNEPRLVGHPNEWRFDEAVPACVEAARCINALNQAFVDTVRAGGGRNARRYLLCPGYAAAPEGALTPHFQLPADPVQGNDGRVLVSVHAYSPYPFALAGEEQAVTRWDPDDERDWMDMTWFMDALYSRYIARGVGVLLDEFGARNRDNLSERCVYAEHYAAEARRRGMPCFWWDNNLDFGRGERFRLIDRRKLEWAYPEIVRAILRGAENADIT